MDYADYAYRHPRLEFYRAIKDLAAERAEHQRLRQVYDTLRDEALLAATEQRRLLREQYDVAQWIDDAHRGVDTTAIPANARGERAIGAGRSEWRNQLVYQKDTLFPADHDIWRDPDMIAALANDDKDLRFAVLRRYLDRAVADLADTMHTWIRASDDVLEEILRGGEFKNQYFTGSSKGMNNPMARLDAENALFGYDYPKTSNFKKYGSRYGQSLAETGAIDEAHLRQRPIYGYITDDPMGGWGPHDSVRQYGNVRVRLKSQVRPRTTVTGDDSLGFAGGAQSGEWDKWTVRELRPDTMRLLARPLNALDSRFLNPNDLTGSVAVLRDTLWREARYLEAQYHGGLRVADIAEVVFPADGGDYHELQRMLMRLGIPFRTVL